jgi:primosomal replication protein N
MNNGTLKIEKGIPIPVGRSGNKWVATARAMEAGDSVLVNGRIEAMNMRNAIIRLGFKAVTRGNDKPQTRVWKVAKESQ